ncbi:MAG: type II secretion system F family protein [Vulcanimicrobiota bacterium]
MGLYVFKAIDCEDEFIHGSMRGPSAEWVTQRLMEVHKRVLLVEEKRERGASGLGLQVAPRVKKDNLAVYCRQMATMVNAGISVNRAVRFCSQGEDVRLNVVMNNVANEIEEGASVSQAFDTYRKTFGDVFVALSKAGEDSGTLDSTLRRLADLLEKTVRMQKKVQSTMAYPAVIAVVCVGVLLLFTFYIIPMMVPVFTDLGVSLPWPTRLLVWIATMAAKPAVGVPIFGCMAFGFFALHKIYQNLDNAPHLRYQIDHWVIKIPVLGPLLELSAQARVLFTMSTMLDAGVSLAEVLGTVQRVASNAVLASKLKWAREELLNGAGIYTALQKYDAFNPMALQMVKVGEETGTLDRMLGKVGAMYEAQVDHQLEVLSSLIEPLIMAVMGTIVGFITVASFLPMIQLLNNL